MRLLVIILFCFGSVQAQINIVATTTNAGGQPSAIPFSITDDDVTGQAGYEFNYVGGGWQRGESISGWLNGTLHYSGVTNAYAEFIFAGTGVDLYTETRETHGIIAISIDGGAETNVDLYAASATQQVLVYASGTLSQAVHTIKIRCTGTKNASSSAFWCIVDYLKVYNPQEVPVPPATFDLFATTSGSDANPCTEALPCLTYDHVLSIAVSGDTIKLGPGTFTLTGFRTVPAGVSTVGSGVDVTYIKGNASMNFTADISLFQWAFDKYMLQVTSGTTTDANQIFQDLTFDGDNRAKHGAMYILNRNDVTLLNVKFNGFGFAGMYAVSTDNLDITGCTAINCSVSTSIVSSGALTFGHNTNTTIDNLTIDEGAGYGIKAFGPAPVQPIVTNFKVLNSHVSVTPTSSYGGGGISNIAIELHDSFIVGAEIANTYTDATVSVVTATAQGPTYSGSAEVAHIHHNVMDMVTRSGGTSYCLETAAHNLVIDHNYFYGGSNAAIASWNASEAGQPAKNNWWIHSNTFYGQQSYYPSHLVISRYTPLSNLKFENNTVDITGNLAVYVISIGQNHANSTWFIRNNIINDRSTADAPPSQGGANKLIALESGSTITTLNVSYNYVFGMPVGTVGGAGNYSNNSTSNPQLNLSGVRPDPYYRPQVASPVRNAGIDVGLDFTGPAPTIGAWEYGL